MMYDTHSGGDCTVHCCSHLLFCFWNTGSSRTRSSSPCIAGCSFFFFFASRRRHTRYSGDWSSDVCSSDLSDKSRILVFSGRRRQAGCIGDGGSFASFRDLSDGPRILAATKLSCHWVRIPPHAGPLRSEERRVGKGCRARTSLSCHRDRIQTHAGTLRSEERRVGEESRKRTGCTYSSTCRST